MFGAFLKTSFLNVKIITLQKLMMSINVSANSNVDPDERKEEV